MVDPPSAPPERKRGSGVRLAYEVLRDEILDLTLPPGSPVDEVALAERFAMSRTPIREALVRLEGEGLVTTLPNRSTVVANIDFPNLNAFFDALTLMYRVTSRSIELTFSAQPNRFGLVRTESLRSAMRGARAVAVPQGPPSSGGSMATTTRRSEWVWRRTPITVWAMKLAAR